MTQMGFYFDQTRCTGCHTCAVSCKDWHDIPAGSARWMRILKKEEGRFPELFISYLISPCYHCENPVCQTICPNEAISKRQGDGIVVVDREKCRGEHNCGIILNIPEDLTYGEMQAPCQLSCPAHLNIPAYTALIAKGRFKEAIEVIRRRMPLPSVCGRVCLHPCETVCHRQEIEEPVAIMALKRFTADNVMGELPLRLPQTQNEKVAIIGSGPAGLAAAYDLIRLGYGVTVFEADTVVGGMLATGISAHRLPKEALKKDIDYIKALGIEIKTSTPVDLENGFDDLLNKQGYRAILLALGTGRGQRMSVPGAELAGTVTGLEFMRNYNLGNPQKIGRRVLVVGGGNVAMECARCARRLGVKEVHVICLESEEEIPAEKSEVLQAKEEGVTIHSSSSLLKIKSSAGMVGAVKLVKITGLRVVAGSPQFKIVKDSGYSIETDMVIFAIGQRPDTTGLGTGCGVECNPNGTICADEETMMTGRRGVFIAGDVATGRGNIIDAIASGQRAAFYMDRYLQGEVLRVKPQRMVEETDIKVKIPASTKKQPRRKMPLLPVGERLTGSREVALGFDENLAISEAMRCLNCAGHLCKDVCPYSAPQFADEEKAKMQKCDLCLERLEKGQQTICVEACPLYALDVGNIDMLMKKHSGTSGAYGLPPDNGLNPSVIFKAKRKINVSKKFV